MLLALKLLVVLGVLSYALAAVLSERELVVHSHHYPAASAAAASAGAAAAAAGARARAAFQHPLSHFVRRPRASSSSASTAQGQHHGHGHLAGAQGEELLGRRTCRIESTLYSKRQQGPLLQRSLRHRPPALEGGQDGKVITTVDGLRVKHGHGSFWGDLNHVETRLVYHQLLPRHLLQDAHAHADRIPVEDLARLASMARHAARLYARERSSLPLRVLAGLYDGFRHLHAFGRWSWTGMTYDEVWAKYESKVKEELRAQGKIVLDDPTAASLSSHKMKKDALVHRRELNRLVALRILEKSCETNPGFDRFAQVERAKAALLASHQHQQATQAAGSSSSSTTTTTTTAFVSPPPPLSLSSALRETGQEQEQPDVVGAVGAWAAKSSPLFPLLDHFARLAKRTDAGL